MSFAARLPDCKIPNGASTSNILAFNDTPKGRLEGFEALSIVTPGTLDSIKFYIEVSFDGGTTYGKVATPAGAIEISTAGCSYFLNSDNGFPSGISHLKITSASNVAADRVFQVITHWC